MEDQTDEYFFDKLVDNEVGVSESGPNFVENVKSGEAKAFSSIKTDEISTEIDAIGGEGEKQLGEVIGSASLDTKKDIFVSEGSNSLEPSNLVVGVNTANANDVVRGANVASCCTTSNTGVKEVQWSSFCAMGPATSGGFELFSESCNELGDGSVDPFVKVGDNLYPASSLAEGVVADLTTTSTSAQQLGQTYGAVTEQTADVQYWENLYPGWRYDPSTGEWHQVVGYNVPANSHHHNLESSGQTGGDDVVSEKRSEVSYLQQTAQSAVGNVAEGCTTNSVFNWNQVSQDSSAEYPAHMVFDPQYPGWYYDTIAQEWCLLESYTPSVQSINTEHNQQIQKENALMGSLFTDNDHNSYGDDGQLKSCVSKGLGGQYQGDDWAAVGSASNYIQQNMSGAVFNDKQKSESLHDSMGPVNNGHNQQLGFRSMGTALVHDQRSQKYDGNGGMTSFIPSNNFNQHTTQPKVEQSQQMHSLHDYYGSQKSGSYSHQPFQTSTQYSYASNEGRSSAGRPPHAVVTFGFGGKLIVLKDSNSFVTNSGYGHQESIGSSISILNLMDVFLDKSSATSIGIGNCDYFRTLCHQSYPGPLVGGNVGSKELNKWIDERITTCESSDMDYRKGEVLRLLLSLLKIACQHYGKFRSPFGTETTLKESDRPESAVAKLFASSKRNGAQMSGYGSLTHCLQNFPSEGQIRATAVEVQNLLVSGRAKEALQCAQEGQLWGLALILAAQLGDQFHADTVKQMAHRQLVAGSPLRTLCLLIAGQPADVFSTDNTISSGPPAAENIYHQPVQIGANCMLDDWEENLAVITANRTKGDELVIVHLGDCLWKERGEITAAHACYLVAEANFETYSDSARLCLIGADHWKYPRTYASPQAIQRTEFYEYSMVLGNSQSILLPFQPYKLIYAYMLAEVGKMSDSLKYCQATLKSLKTGRAPEVDTWRQLLSSLEERIRTHQQGGYSTNLAPAKLVGKLLPFIDRSIHRMIGAPTPPVSSISQSSIQNNEHDNHSAGPRVLNSQSTMAMSSLMPSSSVEPISEWTGDSNRMSKNNRSISEPDFGRSPRQVPSKKGISSDVQGKASISSAPIRFGRFGAQLLQKTVGWVSRSRPDRQAKLGEKNKFYYDEKLKRWVEEGAESPSEETALPPPPTTAAFQNGMSDYNTKNTFRSENFPANGGPEIKSPTPSERRSGMPPIPPSSNQFSARGRMGVRTRYVDTFNKSGGNPTNLFQSNSAVAKPGGGANAKFFIPTPVAASGQQAVDATGESMHEAIATYEDPAPSVTKDSLFSAPPPSSLSSMQRFPSMDNIAPMGNKGMGAVGNNNGSLSSRSRRTVSWSGSFPDAFNPPNITESKPLVGALGTPQSSFLPVNPSSMRMTKSNGSFGDDLQEVEL